MGSKSPAFVERGAHIARSTGGISLGKMLDAGQICLAPDYVFAPAAKEARVVHGFKAAASPMYPTLLDNSDNISVMGNHHHQRLTEWIDDGRVKGATIEGVNPANENSAAPNSRKMPLHIVRDVTDDVTLMQEEIFGPVLSIIRYHRIDGAIGRVNARGRPLGLYYVGSDSIERRGARPNDRGRRYARRCGSTRTNGGFAL